MHLDHHFGTPPDRAHEGIALDNLLGFPGGCELLALPLDPLRDVRAHGPEVLAELGDPLLLGVLHLRGGPGGREVAGIGQSREAALVAQGAEQILRGDPPGRVNGEVDRGLRVGFHHEARRGEAQRASQPPRHPRERLEDPVLEAGRQTVGECLGPFPHRLRDLLGTGLGAIQHPCLREDLRCPQGAPRCIIDTPRAAQGRRGGQAQLAGAHPARVVPHGHRQGLQFGGIDLVGQDQHVLIAHPFDVDGAGRALHVEGHGYRRGGAGAGDHAGGIDRERPFRGGKSGDAERSLRQRVVPCSRGHGIRQARLGIRQPVFHGAPFRRRLTRRIRPRLCSRHHPRQGNALDDARGPGALRSGRRSPPGGGNRFLSGHGRSPRPKGALAGGGLGGGNGALPMLRLMLGRRDDGNRTRLPLRPVLGGRDDGNDTRITSRRPRRRGGRNSALPALG